MKQRIKASHARIRNSFSFFKPTKVIQLIKEAIQEWQKDKVSSLAASLGRASFASTYGAAGSLVFFLAWVYYSAQILLFGAELTKIYARRYGSQILPDKNSTRV